MYCTPNCGIYDHNPLLALFAGSARVNRTKMVSDGNESQTTTEKYSDTLTLMCSGNSSRLIAATFLLGSICRYINIYAFVLEVYTLV